MNKMPIIVAISSVSAIVLVGLLCGTIVEMKVDFLHLNLAAPGVKIDAEMRKNQ